MRYVIAAIAMLSCMTILATGQARKRSSVETPCRMSADQLPDIRGLRLGMSVADVSAVFPEPSSRKAIQKAVDDAKKPESYGFAIASLFRSESQANPNFAGLESIQLELLDERVSSFTVRYDRQTPWDAVDQFAARLAHTFHLPAPEHWKLEYGVRVLTCNGFTIFVFLNNGNGITVKNATAEQVVRDRREAAKEKVREAFKP